MFRHSASSMAASSLMQARAPSRSQNRVADAALSLQNEDGRGQSLIRGIPVHKAFIESIGKSRASAIGDQPTSRNIIAQEERSRAAQVFKAVLLDATDGDANIMADKGLIAARFTRHTASSAQRARSKGQSVVRTAPAFVNVGEVVKKKLAELEPRVSETHEHNEEQPDFGTVSFNKNSKQPSVLSLAEPMSVADIAPMAPLVPPPSVPSQLHAGNTQKVNSATSENLLQSDPKSVPASRPASRRQSLSEEIPVDKRTSVPVHESKHNAPVRPRRDSISSTVITGSQIRRQSVSGSTDQKKPVSAPANNAVPSPSTATKPAHEADTAVNITKRGNALEAFATGRGLDIEAMQRRFGGASLDRYTAPEVELESPVSLVSHDSVHFSPQRRMLLDGFDPSMSSLGKVAAAADAEIIDMLKGDLSPELLADVERALRNTKL
jgi:hypothetical protein